MKKGEGLHDRGPSPFSLCVIQIAKFESHVLLTGFHFFCHVYLFTVGVDKLVLQETEVLTRINLHTKAVSQLPFEVGADETFGDVSFHVWIDVELESLLTKIVDNVIDFVLQRVGEQDGGLDDALTETGGADFLYMHVHSRTDTLSCDLHETEFAQWQDVVACTVTLHDLCHVFVELLVVLGTVHVDEIDNDDATHVSQSQLASQFFSSFHVHCKGVFLLIVESAIAVT